MVAVAVSFPELAVLLRLVVLLAFFLEAVAAVGRVGAVWRAFLRDAFGAFVALGVMDLVQERGVARVTVLAFGVALRSFLISFAVFHGSPRCRGGISGNDGASARIRA